jgi:amino acid adenylation domain-containing protein
MATQVISDLQRGSAPSLVLGRIAARAKEIPDAVAIACGDSRVTFAELETRSNQIAHLLICRGIGLGDVVAILMDRSPLFPVVALGVMKSGAAYLPIDTEYPEARINFVLRDAQASAVFVESEARGNALAGVPSLLVDKEFSICLTLPVHGPEVEIENESLAYLIYTSGSTGQPKGVELTHGALANLIAWHVNAFSVTANDRSTLASSLGFDAAVWEIWPSLCAGASLHIPNALTRLLPEQLRDWMVQEQVTISFAPTCIAEHLMSLKWPHATALRYLLTGADTLRRYAPQGLPFEVVNNYGPTECTVVATSGIVPTEPGRDRPPSIGRVICGMEIHVLDEQLHPVDPGTEGQIWISGAGLARGYRKNEALTRERFVVLQREDGSEVRAYRTGDLGRMAVDGEVEFIARADQQIKILGNRIEPQEIEFLLNRHPAVRSSAVIAVEDSRQDKQLVAYLVTEDGAEGVEWSEYLGQSLPRYMVPSIFVRIHELPITPNGKLDRAALPDPSTESTDSSLEEFDAPQTEVEKRVSKIVGQLLGLETVSIRDNFFQLGGHSLFGAQVIARVRDEFGLELQLRQVFEQPTVELLARGIEEEIILRIQAMQSTDGRG